MSTLNPITIIDQIIDDIIKYRRYFHQHPELSMREYHTQTTIIEALSIWGIPYQKVANTGVLATITNNEGPCVLIRADIDALPILEENDVFYKSLNDHVMHACGHDAHTAILLGTAYTLNELKSSFSGTIKLIFQPNEEVSGGAQDCVRDGIMSHPTVDYVIGLHVMPNIKTGKIEVKYDTLNASTGSIAIHILGKAGHAAYPESGIDSIRIASKVVTALYAHFDPIEDTVLTLSKINGGVKTNIIASDVLIEGTLRCITSQSRQNAKEQITKIVNTITDEYKAKNDITFYDGYPVLVNDSLIVDQIITSAKNTIGEENIVYKDKPSMGGEDFGYYLEHAKGAFFHLGCQIKEDFSPLHSSTFNVNEDAIKTGILVEVQTALDLLKKG